MLCGAATADIHSSGEWVKGIRMGICIIESPVIHCCSVAKSYRFFVTPWTAVYQVSLSFAISRSLLRLMSVELVMPYSHLILCRPLLLLPSVFPSIRVPCIEAGGLSLGVDLPLGRAVLVLAETLLAETGGL